MEAAVIKKRTRKIPEALIYDEIDGKPYYRKGYKSVLNKTQTQESIMGCSSLQSLIVHFFLKNLFLNAEEKYFFFTNEPGLHLEKGNNLSGDILIYEKSRLPSSVFTKHYFEIPPFVQIEVDVIADLDHETEVTYIHKKVSKLLSFGVSKVIWVFTAAESILIATPDGPWQWINWNSDVELLAGLTVNVGRFMASIND